MADTEASVEEELLAIVINCLRVNQSGPSACCWYEAAIGKCEDALEDLQIKRSADRKQRLMVGAPNHDA